MAWLTLLATLSIGTYVAWLHRGSLARSVVFEGLTRAIENWLAGADLAAAVPRPAGAYPGVRLFVRSIVFSDPRVNLRASAGGIEFVLSVSNLTIDVSTTGTMATTGRAFASRVTALGSLQMDPNLVEAHAPVYYVTVDGFIFQLAQRDALSLAAAAMSGAFRDQLKVTLERSVKDAIETRVPLVMLEYADTYPSIVSGIVQLVQAAEE